MCEVPPRSWRQLVTPARAGQFLAGVGILGGAVVAPSRFVAALLGMAAALILAAVVLPAVNQIEFGFPATIKIVTAVRRRTDELRRVFEEQKSDLHLCAGLMCDEPEAATAMLEAAFARAIAAWRGPPNPALRVYVLCSFVHLLTARDTWVRRGAGQNAAGTPLATLPLPTRIAVVLREFANLPVADIAVIVGRTADDVTRDLARAAAELERRRSERRWWSR